MSSVNVDAFYISKTKLRFTAMIKVRIWVMLVLNGLWLVILLLLLLVL